MYGIKKTLSNIYVVYDNQTGKGVYWTATYKEAEKYVKNLNDILISHFKPKN